MVSSPSIPHLRILFVSAEVAPYAKVGGLADVAGSLPKVLRASGHDVRIIMPRYGRIGLARYGLEPLLGTFSVSLPDRNEPASLLQTTLDGDVPVYAVESCGRCLAPGRPKGVRPAGIDRRAHAQ